MFDVQKLADFAYQAIQTFAASHLNEKFHAFAIDGESLCFDSEEHFEKTRAYYAETASEATREFYTSEKFAQRLRGNPGDWAYQGFAMFDDSNGLDRKALYHALDLEPGELKNSEYFQAMQEVLEILRQRNAFAALPQTINFRAFIVNQAENE